MMAERLGSAVRTAFGALCLVALGACGASSDACRDHAATLTTKPWTR
jgi:hypothetical protein